MISHALAPQNLYNLRVKTCDICGTFYTPVKSWQKRCSKKCNSIASNTRRRESQSRKRCSTCWWDLPVEEFLPAHRSCIVCEELRCAKLKRCRKCQQVKSHDDFHRRVSRPGGVESKCKACRSQRTSTEEELEKRRRAKYPARYGITYEQVLAMVEAQGGRCAICFDELDAPHVDHNHTTGEVRAILCRHCNTVLGHARDDVQILLSAIEYLRRHGS